MVDVTQQITNMNAGWYNVVSQALNLDPTTFRLAQGTLGLQTSDNSGLYLMSDSEPPSAAVFFDGSGLSKRSSSYGMLLQALKPESGQSLQQILGNQYANWIAYRDAYFNANPTTTKTQADVFTLFANQRLDPGAATNAISAYNKAAHTPLNAAIAALYDPANTMTFVNSAGNQYSLKQYSIDINNVIAQMNSSSSVSINFDSSSMDTTLKNNTANGGASGFYSIFSGGASASFTQLDTKAVSSDFTITGTIGQNATMTTSPVGWFDSGEFSRGYNSQPNDQTIWDPQANAGDWNSFFAQPSGSLARRTSQLVFVGDYDITVTSKATYSASEFTQIQTQASFGIWPFFSANASSNSISKATQNADGSLSVRHVLGKGGVQIWGVTVQDAPN
jgi:hypothetical protein